MQCDYDISPANKPHNTSSNTNNNNNSSSSSNSNNNNGRSLYQNQSNTKASSLIKLKAKVLRRNSYDSSDVDDDSYSGTYVQMIKLVKTAFFYLVSYPFNPSLHMLLLLHFLYSSFHASSYSSSHSSFHSISHRY